MSTRTLDDLVGKALGDFAGAWSAMLVNLGDRLGLWRALAGSGPLDPAEIAERAGLADPKGVGGRYVSEWAAGVAAAGYLDYDPATGRFTLTEAQATVFADDTSPVFLTGLAQVLDSVHRDVPALAEAYRAGTGYGWHRHDRDLFAGTERFFRPGYAGNLITAWLPALDGVVAKLAAGAAVADVGCGHGTSTVEMALAFPRARLSGFDYHAESIERAVELAKAEGVDDRVTYATATADAFGGGPYDLVCFFDCLHDMGDPVAALANARAQLAPGGTVLLVEPYAHERLEDNLNLVGQIFYGASATICVPASLDQPGGAALGAQAGEERIVEVARAAGFTRARRAAETPFNLVLELRP